MAFPTIAVTPGSGATVNTLPNAGQTTMAGSLSVAVASDQSAIPVTDNSGSLTVDAPVATPVFVRLSDGAAAITTLAVSLASLPSLAAGTALVGKVGIDQTTPGTTNAVAATGNVAAAAADSGNPVKVGGVYSASLPTLTDGQRGNLQVDANGRLIVAMGTQLDATNDTVSSQPKAATSGGATPYHLISAASTNATSVKASAGQLYSVQLVNRSTTANAYVKFYDKASAPTVGTDTPVKTICLPAAAASTQPTVVVHGFPMPVAFPTGIALAVTGGTGLNADTTAVAANDVTCDFDYK